ncbi:MAG: 6,7-dimethyl-8-ribityllumazine synthase [Variibacter sp.]|nr:6,7-dimethyl-8-ribityllumazine synthase [Variibacter sp.]
MAEPRRRASGFDNVKGAHVLVVEGRFYEDVADALWAGAKRVLDAEGVSFDRHSVPGALEIPQAIALALAAAEAAGKPYDGVVALGCVIRGETSHYDIVAGESARALMDMALARGLPIGNGILTVDTEAQAFARASHNQRDKGGDAARAALSLVAVKRRLAAAR